VLRKCFIQQRCSEGMCRGVFDSCCTSSKDDFSRHGSQPC